MATPADAHVYKYNISMSCSGCSGAIERVLGKLEGVKSYKVDLPSQSAEVQVPLEVGDEGDLSYAAVLEKIKKTGKKVNGGSVDGEERGV